MRYIMNRSLVNFLCAFIPSKGRRHEFRKKYLSCNTDIMTTLDRINLIEEKNDNIRYTNEINSALLNIKDKIKNINNIKIENKNKFLLFKYTYKPHVSWSDTKVLNLGDYVRTVATKKALDIIFKNNQYEYFNRDNVTNYKGEKIIEVMQDGF